MRCSVAGLSTVAGTSVRAVASVFGTSTKGFTLREVGVFNTTTTEVYVALVRFTNATGVGAGLTEVQWDVEHNPVPTATAFAGHTADGAVGSPIRYGMLGAVKGAGVIWTFGDEGIFVNIGTANGIGVICPSGTGQILTYYYDWVE